MKPLISIIYVYYNTPSELVRSIKSISLGAPSIQYEIIIVDNGSFVPIPQKVLKRENVMVIRSKKNGGYGKALNMGAKLAQGKLLLLVNPDTEFKKNSITLLTEQLINVSRLGVVGPQLINNDGSNQQSISRIPFLPYALIVFSFLRYIWPFKNYYKKYHYYDENNGKKIVESISGACMLVKKNAFKKIYGFDERFFMYFEEADFCYRVAKAGYGIMYFPDAKVTHDKSKSIHDARKIKQLFQNSRYKFLKKYHGLFLAIFGEVFLRVFTLEYVFIAVIFSLSLFINVYRIGELMIFFGDAGRDYLAARDMILTKTIPLVGIPSSVVWLHQGPLSVYFIGLSFLLGNFNPIAPAIFYGLLGACTSVLTYYIGKVYFNKSVGVLASIFFATSPLIIINQRMPYHTSPIPFFSGIFFLILYFVLKGKTSFFPFLLFSLGILFQLELSNGVLFPLVLVIFYLYGPKIKRKLIVQGILGFMLGIFPFIIYDFTHFFVQTGGFVLWVINRIRLFFGLTFSGNSTTIYGSGAIETIIDEMRRLVFPKSTVVFIFIFTVVCISFWFKRKKMFNKNPDIFLLIISLWIFVPIVGYIVHAHPGSAYFPLIFIPISVLVASSFTIIRNTLIIVSFFIFIGIINVTYTLTNNYFMQTNINILHNSQISGWSYGFGPDFNKRLDVVNFIIADSKGRPFVLRAGGFIAKYKTGVDNYKYIAWWKKGKIQENAKITYTIYEDKKDIQEQNNILYDNGMIFIEKNENY